MPEVLANVFGDSKKTIMTPVRKYYGQLVGATVKYVVLVKPDDETWNIDEFTPLLVFEKDGELLYVELWSDPEGNGAGHANIMKEGDLNG
jgi:hypothetical protein